jgi:hypothetical protein
MADPLFGKTWKMNAGSSLFSTDFRPAQETRLYEERPNGYKLTVSGTQNGKPYSWWYEAYHDGRSYPVHGRDDVDAITIFKLSDTHTCGFFTQRETEGGAYARKLDIAKNTLTVQAGGRHADGSPYFDVTSYTL